MKILKRGNRNQYNPPEIETHTHECPICGCLFEYLDVEVRKACYWWSDSLGNMHDVVDCPWCGEELII